jgi:hypothetical protein
MLPLMSKDHADRNRGVFAGERLDLLLVFAFEKVEVLAVESGYQPVQGSVMVTGTSTMSRRLL